MAADASVEAKIETDGQQKSFFCYFWDGGERRERKNKKVSSDKIFLFKAALLEIHFNTFFSVSRDLPPSETQFKAQLILLRKVKKGNKKAHQPVGFEAMTS